MAQAVRPMPEEMPRGLWRGYQSNQTNWQGSVSAIYVAPHPSDPMVALPQVRAVTDSGLEGDRFYRESWSAVKRDDKAVSLIEDEVLQLAAAELGLDSIAEISRRNIVTRGVPLIDLLHREFTIGGVRMRGIRLFEPCGHLVALTKLPGIFKALEHRSGLKAAVLSDGVIKLGDTVALAIERKAAAGSLG